MPRRRHEQNPKIYRKDGRRKFRYYADRFQDGTLSRVRREHDLGPAEGKGALTEDQAEKAKQRFLKENDRPGQVLLSKMTVEDYFLGPYNTHLAATSKNNQSQVDSLWRHHIQPAIGRMSLADVGPRHVQALLTQMEADGYSPSTIKHVKKVIAGVFADAYREKAYRGDNPAKGLRLPAPRAVNRRPVLPFKEAAYVLTRVRALLAAMVTLALCCSCNLAELLGLKWSRLNLSDEMALCDNEYLPPRSAKIAQNYVRKEFKATKTVNRCRIIPLPDALVEWLKVWRGKSLFSGPNDPVFSSKRGKPLYAANNRVFQNVAIGIGIRFTWNSLRHSFRMYCDLLKVPEYRRKMLMGHSLTQDIGDVYGHATFDELRAIVNGIAEKIQASRALLPPASTPRKVTSIR
jgi:integrase